MSMVSPYKAYAPVLLRIALASVFLWFGISQLVNPESFMGYVPQWLYPHDAQMMHAHPLQFMHDIPIPSIHFLIMGNGVLESFFGLLLLVGLFTRLSSAVLAIHLFGIALSLGYNDIAVRDAGLAFATLSLFLSGADAWSLDTLLQNTYAHKKK